MPVLHFSHQPIAKLFVPLVEHPRDDTQLGLVAHGAEQLVKLDSGVIGCFLKVTWVMTVRVKVTATLR